LRIKLCKEIYQSKTVFLWKIYIYQSGMQI